MAKKPLAILLALALLTSCFSVRQDRHYYVLVAEPSSVSAGANLEEVKLATYLDRLDLCYLAKSGELVRLPKAKWAQSLSGILKNYLITATRPSLGTLTDDTPRATVFIDQFLMNADGTFQVAGAVEIRMRGLPTERKGFAFLLPSRGKPSVATMIEQSQLALEKILAEQLHANK